jgi:integrase
VNGGTYSTKREAQQARNAAATRIDQGKILSPSRETFAEYLPAWLERHARTDRGLRPATVANYRRYIVQDIAPSNLGGMRLRDIRRRHINTFVDQLVDAGRGAVTVRRIVAVVQGSLRAAAAEERIEDNPATLLRLPRVESKDFQPWEPEQVGIFLDVAGDHRLGALFEVAVFTGLRRGELLGLRWSDVDLVGRELVVHRNLTTSGEGRTKTEAGRRRVALDDRAVGALIAWQIAQDAEAAAWGLAYVATGAVFTYENGESLKPQYVTRLFEKLRQRAVLPPMTFHGLRHQHASLQLAAGTPLAVVSKRLGHQSVAITADIYSHLLRSTEHEAANNAAALVPERRSIAHTLHTQGARNEEAAASTMIGNGR